MTHVDGECYVLRPKTAIKARDYRETTTGVSFAASPISTVIIALTTVVWTTPWMASHQRPP